RDSAAFVLLCHPAMRSRASLARPRALASHSSSTISRSRFSACFAFSLPSAKAASARTKAYSSFVAISKGPLARGPLRTPKPCAAATRLPPRLGEAPPAEDPPQARHQQAGDDENADVAPLALHNPHFRPAVRKGQLRGIAVSLRGVIQYT